MGLRGPEKVWAEIKDYNPDCNPSSSARIFIERDHDMLCVLQVKGLGVITMRVCSSWASDTGALKFEGLGIFTKDEIGYAPSL